MSVSNAVYYRTHELGISQKGRLGFALVGIVTYDAVLEAVLFKVRSHDAGGRAMSWYPSWEHVGPAVRTVRSLTNEVHAA